MVYPDEEVVVVVGLRRLVSSSSSSLNVAVVGEYTLGGTRTPEFLKVEELL